jgi:hypothetical protein
MIKALDVFKTFQAYRGPKVSLPNPSNAKGWRPARRREALHVFKDHRHTYHSGVHLRGGDDSFRVPFNSLAGAHS